VITITLTQALGLYAAIVGIGALTIWVYTEVASQRTHRTLEQQHLWRCVFCAYTYLDEAAGTLSQCPRCGSYNALEDAHAKFVVPAGVGRDIQPEKPEPVPESPRRNPSRRRRAGARRGPRRRR
jgi:hypothetical protein